MTKIAIAIHGGAEQVSEQIKNNETAYEEGLQEAVEQGYAVLDRGGSSVDAVEAAVNSLEDNSLFNAGRGAALNNKGEVEMDAAIMDGKDLRSGGVAMVQQIKNPVSLAKAIMLHTKYILIGDKAALHYAKSIGMPLQPKAYFITERQYNSFMQMEQESVWNNTVGEKSHGTVGAVALDKNGNIAAATSTGGTSFKQEGRIGDSCIIGAGCYANNKTCAVSGTGDGEYLIQDVMAHHIAMVMEYTGRSVQEACDFVIHKKNKNSEGEFGVIALDVKGNFGFSFNTDCLFRGWMSNDSEAQVRIYK
jgi:beta-aspartyl-peptidase (threonine type)